jgi:photosystem II stability/assembly factor-like uncharacterized protein
MPAPRVSIFGVAPSGAVGRRAVRSCPLAFALGALVLAAPAAAQWSPLPSPTADTLRSVDFAGDSTGWVAGYNGVVRRSVDAGQLWTPQDSGTSVRLLSVDFVDANTGWINGGLYVARTTDGGADWNMVTTDPSALIFRNKGAASAANTYWVPAGCATCVTRWFYRYTIDPGGMSTEPTFDLVGSTAPFLDMHFVDADNGWAVGNAGLIRRITAASTGTPGFAFQTCTNCMSAALNGIFMLDANTGWLVGNTGTIRATVDGGTTWTPQNAGTAVNLRDVHFRDAMTGWIVGDGGTILATTNGGADWTPENSGVGVALFGVVATTDAVYAVGGDLATSTNGVVLKRTDIVFADGFE